MERRHQVMAAVSDNRVLSDATTLWLQKLDGLLEQNRVSEARALVRIRMKCSQDVCSAAPESAVIGQCALWDEGIHEHVLDGAAQKNPNEIKPKKGTMLRPSMINDSVQRLVSKVRRNVHPEPYTHHKGRLATKSKSIQYIFAQYPPYIVDHHDLTQTVAGLLGAGEFCMKIARSKLAPWLNMLASSAMIAIVLSLFKPLNAIAIWGIWIPLTFFPLGIGLMNIHLVKACLTRFRPLFLLFNGLGFITTVCILFRELPYQLFGFACCLPWAMIPPVVDALPPKIRAKTWFHFLVTMFGCILWALGIYLDWFEIKEMHIGPSRVSTMSISFAFHMMILCFNALLKNYTSRSSCLVSLSAPMYSVSIQESTAEVLAQLDPSNILKEVVDSNTSKIVPQTFRNFNRAVTQG